MAVNKNLNLRGNIRLNFIEVEREQEVLQEFSDIDDDDKSYSVISSRPPTSTLNAMGAKKQKKRRTEEDDSDEEGNSGEGLRKKDLSHPQPARDNISEIVDSEDGIDGDDGNIFSPKVRRGSRKAKVLHKKMRTTVKKSKEVAYIDFKEFSRYIALLNPAASQDQRIKCKRE